MGTIAWTSSELESIKQQTLGDLRPSYYSASSQSLIQISDDFEGYLILQNSDEKSSILNWISNLNSINNDVKDQNVLLQRFMSARTADATDRITELDSILNNYAKMEANLITDGNDPSRYGSIVELNLMVTDLARGLDNISIQREQAFHEQNLINAITAVINAEIITDQFQKEVDSWQSIVSTYSGQSQQPASTVGIPAVGGMF